MESKGLLFIPDISGFTRFINSTEINHSKLIIQELLEVLLNANEMNLQVSEIEGDAILFYKYGEPPQLEELYDQVEKMFYAFHQNLMAYEEQRYCWCTACRSAIDLTLKVVTHYGEFTGYNVKDFNKLIGRDVIVAHQLLKNDIEPHEYWLVTKELLPAQETQMIKEWMQWNSSSKETDSGSLAFQYTYISPLRKHIPALESPDFNLAAYAKMFRLTREYESDIIRLFHASGNFQYRNQWMEGVKEVKGITHSLPRIGTSCILITDEGEFTVRSNSYSASPERLEFTEINEQNNHLHHYLLETMSDNKTKLTFTYYIPKGIFSKIAFTLLRKKKMEAYMKRSLERLSTITSHIQL